MFRLDHRPDVDLQSAAEDLGVAAALGDRHLDRRQAKPPISSWVRGITWSSVDTSSSTPSRRITSGGVAELVAGLDHRR